MKRLLVLPLLTLGCATTPASPPAASGDAPYVVVLGTAQDAGLPQIGCELDHCERARRDPGFERLVTSLLLADPVSGERWLFDASGARLREDARVLNMRDEDPDAWIERLGDEAEAGPSASPAHESNESNETSEVTS